MLLVKHDEISEGKLKASISALKENKRTQLKNTRRKDLSARQGLLTGFEKSHLPTACFNH